MSSRSWASLIRACSAGCGAKLKFERTPNGKWAPLEWPGEPREVFISAGCSNTREAVEDQLDPGGCTICFKDAGDHRPEGVPGERRMLISERGAIVEMTWPSGSGGKPVTAFVNHFVGCPAREQFRRAPARAGRKG